MSRCAAAGVHGKRVSAQCGSLGAGVRALADGIRGGYDVEVGRAIRNAGVRKTFRGRTGDCRVWPTADGCALHVVGGRP